jgi:predicted ATP-grasp superfamily ATP-dependent carboligase
VQVFVYEFTTSGAVPAGLNTGSLAVEGEAMLRAAIADFAACPGVRVTTVLDAVLFPPTRFRVAAADGAPVDVDAHPAGSPQIERELFARLAAQSDATFVIAPETGGCLEQRRRLVEAVGGRFLGHGPQTLCVCGDKLRFAECLTRAGVPTIPTLPWDVLMEAAPFDFPLVVKPREGAGSQDTFLVRDQRSWSAFRAQHADEVSADWIVQPFVRGRSLSVAVVGDAAAGRFEVLPVAEQCLSRDGRFQYRGGCVPAGPLPSDRVGEIVLDAWRLLPDASGYIGFDVIQPVRSADPVIVEANPRLTTSYVGYRALCLDNLAARLLTPSLPAAPLAWRTTPVRFAPDGRVRPVACLARR